MLIISMDFSKASLLLVTWLSGSSGISTPNILGPRCNAQWQAPFGQPLPRCGQCRRLQSMPVLEYYFIQGALLSVWSSKPPFYLDSFLLFSFWNFCALAIGVLLSAIEKFSDSECWVYGTDGCNRSNCLLGWKYSRLRSISKVPPL